MLKRLEAQLGERLFERSTRAMRLTAEGQTLLEYATRALEMLHEGEAQLSAQSRSLVGTVRVSAPSDLTRHVLLRGSTPFCRPTPACAWSCRSAIACRT